MKYDVNRITEAFNAVLVTNLDNPYGAVSLDSIDIEWDGNEGTITVKVTDESCEDEDEEDDEGEQVRDVLLTEEESNLWFTFPRKFPRE